MIGFASPKLKRNGWRILYYRNKIGIEETREILKNYLSKADRNLPALHRYAEQMGCGKILRTYLEVLL